MMKVAKNILLASVLLVAVVSARIAGAGPYIDELSKCIVESTTLNDREAFVRWMFSAASLHPAVKSIAAVSADQLDASNKQTAELFTRLLTETCRQQAEKAIKYEGAVALQSSFQVLGQVAGRELFSSPDVAAGMAGLEKYIDGDKLKSALTIK